MKLMLSYPSLFSLSTMFCSALPSELLGKCFNNHLDTRRDAYAATEDQSNLHIKFGCSQAGRLLLLVFLTVYLG